MTALDMFQFGFITIVFLGGLVGFFIAATSDD